MAITGQGADISDNTTSYSGINWISITPPGGVSEPIQAPHLGLAAGANVPMLTGDLIFNTEVGAQCELDPDFDWEALVNVTKDITVTYQNEATNAATDAFSGWLIGFTPDSMTTGERCTGTMRFAVNGAITKTASS